MEIRLPRGLYVDVNDIPEDFDEIVRKTFEEYTEGTAEDYTYQDKLHFIDLCRKYVHRAEDGWDCVVELMKDRFETELRECGEIMSEEDFLCTEFMEECFNAGRTNLYHHYTGNHHIDDKIMEVLVRVIKVVINY